MDSEETIMTLTKEEKARLSLQLELAKHEPDVDIQAVIDGVLEGDGVSETELDPESYHGKLVAGLRSKLHKRHSKGVIRERSGEFKLDPE
jgi:hypothetical protein